MGNGQVRLVSHRDGRLDRPVRRVIVHCEILDSVVEDSVRAPHYLKPRMTAWFPRQLLDDERFMVQIEMRIAPGPYQFTRLQPDLLRNHPRKQRSCDVALGLPFNLWSGALLQRMIAQQTDLEPGEFVWMGGDTHLYLNHEHLVTEQLSREPQGCPTLDLKRRPETIFDYAIEDFEVSGYTPHGAIKAPVAV